MRHRKVAPWALVMALVAGTGNPALCQPPSGSQGGLITRYFKRPAASKSPEKDDPVASATLTLAPAARRAQALADWTRRVEVCQRLHEIAYQEHDEDLKRKADQLLQRADDLWAQQTSRLPVAVPEEPQPARSMARRKDKDAAPAASGEDR
jgi:hypothetical protein